MSIEVAARTLSDRGCCSQTASLRFLPQFQYGCHHWSQTSAYVAVCVLLKGTFPSQYRFLLGGWYTDVH